MKWPSVLWLVRHGESAYNILRERKRQDQDYLAFVRAFEDDWRSENTRQLAEKMWKRYALDCGDWNTPLTETGIEQAGKVGLSLSQEVEVPDVIFRSPHDRACQTLEAIMESWPELRKVKVVEEPRLHEQDHGLAVVYNDWRVFHALHPEQKLLYDLQGSYWYRYPQGENVFDVIERCRSFIGTLTRDYSEKNVGVVSHHLTILSFMAAVGRWDHHEFLHWDKTKKPINCGFTMFSGDPNIGEDGKLELVAYNKKLY